MRSPGSADAAASDLVSTLLMVLVVVVVASVLAVAVVGSLSRPVGSDASFVLEDVDAGGAALVLTMRNGEPVAASDLRVLLGRAGAAPVAATWSAPGGPTLAAGQNVTLVLAPAAAASETFRVVLVRADLNAVVADLTAQASGAGSSAYPPASMVLAATPGSLSADSVSSVLVTARLSAPHGALGVAQVAVDLTNLSAATGAPPAQLPLNDLGRDGDVVGGDGVWSALLRASTSTTAGSYALGVAATDAAGNLAASGSFHLTILPGPGCVGCPVSSGTLVTEGARFVAATSANATQIRLRNFTWDQTAPANLANDAITLVVVGGGRSWSARIDLDYVGGQAVAAELTLTSDLGQTVYRPRNASLPLAGLEMNLLDPVGSLQWTYRSGTADPGARFGNALVAGNPILAVPSMRDTSNNGRTAIFAADVVIR